MTALAAALSVASAALSAALLVVSSALSTAFSVAAAAASASFSTALATSVLSTASAVYDSHAARPSARTRAVSATFFMIVPFLASGALPFTGAARGSASQNCQAKATGYRQPFRHAIAILMNVTFLASSLDMGAIGT